MKHNTRSTESRPENLPDPSLEMMDYLAQMIGELRVMALRSNLRDLGYLLAIAEVEVRERHKAHLLSQK